MSSTSEWSPFYQALNRIGPRLLHGVHRDLVEYVALEASDTDSFFSWGLHSAFWDWEQGKCEEAVERALNQWVCSVQQHLGEILGDDSLLPFEQLGITPSKRSELRVSTKRIRLRLDRDHIKTFIDSVLFDLGSNSSSPQLVMQGVIQPYAKSTDGTWVHAVMLPWRRIINLLKRDWSVAYQMSPRDWEELIAAAFDRAGYDEVILTPRSGDHGRDVIAVKKGIGSIRIIDSVKAYKPGHLVRYDDVRAPAGVLGRDLQSSKGIVTTTSDFAPGIVNDPYLKPLMPYRLELMNGRDLKKWLEDLALS